MRNLIFLAFTSLIFNTLKAQENPDAWMVSQGTLQGFEAGGQSYTLVSDANLREKPTTQSTSLAKLAIGTPLTIINPTTDSLTIRGVKLPWLYVKCQITGQGEVKGYIWGGFLALAAIQSPADEYTFNSGVLYLTGVAAYDEKKHQLTAQVRAAKDGKELSKVEFTTQGDLSYYPSFELFYYDRLKQVKAILELNYYYPACGYPSGNNLIIWKENNQMVKVLETSSVSDGGVFYDSEDFILPSQRGGIGEHIIVTKDMSEFEEKDGDFVRTTQKVGIVLYKWNGNTLQKLKEIK
jgi:hypothetical protein